MLNGDNIFTILTPFTYWVLIALWAYILLFYIYKYYRLSKYNRIVVVLLVVLTIDAFRTLFESIYFGLRYTSLAGMLPLSIHEFLVQPQYVFIPKMLNVVAAVLMIVVMHNWFRKENETYKKATHDALTGTMNRYYFDEKLANEIDDELEHNHSYSLIMFDIDHFKSVNDTYGHSTGDRILVSVANIIGSSVRNSDTVIRWGGEEFLVALPRASKEDAAAVAEKIRHTIETTPFEACRNVTVSAGVSSKLKEENFQAFFKRVDDALYRAKQGGRNRVVVS